MNLFEQWQVDDQRDCMNQTMQRIRAEHQRMARREWWAQVIVFVLLGLVVVAQWVWAP